MFEDILKRLARSLAEHDIPYIIIGGQAVLLYGEPRLTADIDVTVGLSYEALPKLTDAVKNAHLSLLVEDPEKFVKKTMVLPTQDPKTKIRVDFILSFTAYEQEAIKRARRVEISRTEVAFASPEDLIIHKIFAGRARDMEDVRGVLLKQKMLDISYIERWLREFDKTFPGRDFLKTFLQLLKASSSP